MVIQKFAQVKKKDERTASFIASTSSSDRYGDVVDQETWLLEGYKKSPVILLNHRQDMLPIGKATGVQVVNGQLEIDVEFDLEDELGKEIARKVNNGFLNAVSVGFQPRKAYNRSDLPSEHKAHGEHGMFFQDNELLEVSVVTIPANSQAVAKSFGDAALEQKIKEIVRSEILGRTEHQINQVKHILQVEEEADRYIVHFAKPDMMEEMTEDLENLEDELPEVEEAVHHEMEEEESEEDKIKHLLNYLFS